MLHAHSVKKVGLACGLALVFPLLACGSAGVQNRIDELVHSRLARDGVVAGDRCSDEVFVRRVWLDVTGTLPTAAEVVRFLNDPSPDRRGELIDRLLLRPEFADYQALKWGDLLRIKAEFPSNLWPNAVQAYHRWIRTAIRNNMPYDEFARALLTASGSNFRDPPSNFYRPFQDRTPRNIFDTVALVLMGVRVDSSGWSEEQRLGMEAFFATVSYKNTAEWKEEIVWSDRGKRLLHPQTGMPVEPVPVWGSVPAVGEMDPREVFAQWLTDPENPWFAKNIVNRIWYWLTGRGIIHEPDDIRPDNPPWCPELLAFLEQELVDAGYDLLHIYRLILHSSTYQLCSIPPPGSGSGTEGFSHYRIRRLDAEVLIDAICRITGTGEEYTSAIPEPFTFVPASLRTLTLADGSIKSPFLEMFGRPSRDTSLESDRNNAVTVFQSLHLLNSSHIYRKISTGPALAKRIATPLSGLSVVETLYLDILSRYPEDHERQIAEAYFRSSGLTQQQAAVDLAWALMNTSEFVFKH